jgi:hypothetical protein
MPQALKEFPGKSKRIYVHESIPRTLSIEKKMMQIIKLRKTEINDKTMIKETLPTCLNFPAFVNFLKLI